MQKYTISLRYLNLIHTSVIIFVGNSDEELENMRSLTMIVYYLTISSKWVCKRKVFIIQKGTNQLLYMYPFSYYLRGYCKKILINKGHKII